MLSPDICCPLATCTKCHACFRHLNYQKQLSEADHYSVLNTHRHTLTGDACPHFIVERTERWAYGFKSLYASIPLGNAHAADFIQLFPSESSYFRSKRGDRPLSPDLQCQILALVAQAGGNPTIPFDRYQDETVYAEGESSYSLS